MRYVCAREAIFYFMLVVLTFRLIYFPLRIQECTSTNVFYFVFVFGLLFFCFSSLFFHVFYGWQMRCIYAFRVLYTMRPDPIRHTDIHTPGYILFLRLIGQIAFGCHRFELVFFECAVCPFT